MEQYNVVFLQDAFDDLEEIIIFISKDNKVAALKLHDKIMEITDKLKTFPKLGVLVPNKKISDYGFRMIIVDKYILFYKIYDKEINILRILHGARDYKSIFNK